MEQVNMVNTAKARSNRQRVYSILYYDGLPLHPVLEEDRQGIQRGKPEPRKDGPGNQAFSVPRSSGLLFGCSVQAPEGREKNSRY